MKKTFMTIAVAFSMIFAATLVSCGDDKEKKDSEKETKDAPKDSVVVTADTGPEVGIIPLDFPVVESTSSKAGEYNLTPSMAFIDKAWEESKEGKSSFFIFYASTCVEPGKGASEVKQIAAKVMIPNSLIIPIPANQTAKKGDIVLTWWQSGSGMQRAIVVNDADPAQPIVKYLDIQYDNPAKNKDGVPIGQMEEQLKLNSFYVMKNEWEPGTTIAYNNGRFEKWQVINISGDKVLAKGHAGVMSVLEKSKCTPIPIRINVKNGDTIQIAIYGKFQDGKVKKVDNTSGRVWVEIDFGGKKSEVVVSQGDIISSLL